MAPIVRRGADGDRELVVARWGMPGPPQFGSQPVTNIRNVKSPHWRGWLGPKNRCIVAATSFCEYADTKPRKTPIWFALAEDRPLFAFAGLWTPWRGVRGPKSNPVEGERELFGFLTTDANAIVAPIHPKAMPVILTTPAEVDRWLRAEMVDALALPAAFARRGAADRCEGRKRRSAGVPLTLARGLLQFPTEGIGAARMARSGTVRRFLGFAYLAEACVGFGCWAIILERLGSLWAAAILMWAGTVLAADATRRFVKALNDKVNP
jgi:putative SOS response-associated peptidase YedK